MRTHLRVLFTATALVVALGVSLSSCALLPQKQLDAAKTATGYALTVYATAYQPILAEYARLPYCGEPAVAPCRDRALYKKLYELDGAVAQCSAAVTATLASNSPDFEAVNECVRQAEAAKLAFATAGMKQ
jgi:hypothetical protein